MIHDRGRRPTIDLPKDWRDHDITVSRERWGYRVTWSRRFGADVLDPEPEIDSYTMDFDGRRIERPADEPNVDERVGVSGPGSRTRTAELFARKRWPDRGRHRKST